MLDILILDWLKEMEIGFAVFSRIRVGVVIGRMIPEVLYYILVDLYKVFTQYRCIGVISGIFSILAVIFMYFLDKKRGLNEKPPKFRIGSLNSKLLTFLLCIALQEVPIRAINSNLMLLLNKSVNNKWKFMIISSREIFCVISGLILPYFERHFALESIMSFGMILSVIRGCIVTAKASATNDNCSLYVFFFLEMLHGIYMASLCSIGPRLARKFVSYDFVFYAQIGYYLASSTIGPVLVSVIAYFTLSDNLNFKNFTGLEMISFLKTASITGGIGTLIWISYLSSLQK